MKLDSGHPCDGRDPRAWEGKPVMLLQIIGVKKKKNSYMPATSTNTGKGRGGEGRGNKTINTKYCNDNSNINNDKGSLKSATFIVIGYPIA